MDLDDDYKFAMDCEINKSLRRTDAIRSSLFQLSALQSKIPFQIRLERQRELLHEYSQTVDKEDGTNTFINTSLLFAKESSRKCMTDKWSSILKKRIDEGMTPAEIVTSLNSNFQPVIDLSKKFKSCYKNRVINFENENKTSSSSSDKSASANENNQDNSNKIVKLIENQLKPSSSPKSKIDQIVKNSPTRVSGIFKKSSKFAKSLFTNTQIDSTSENESHNSQESVESIPIENNSTVDSKEIRKKSFMTGLEKHLVDQVMNNNMDSNQARQIIDDVRKNSVSQVKANKKPKTQNADTEDSEEIKTLVNDERLKGIEKSMIELIQSEIISNLENTDWSQIAGLEYAKSKIKQIAILPLRRPDLFTGIRSPPKGILLFGPPGTGKTMIGRCIASQANATFFSITSSTLTSKWIGDGEKSMKTLFSIARCLKPSVIFIDEVDSLLKSRSDSEHESSRRMKTEFLAQFDGLSNQSNDGLLVIGTTNRPQELDEAVRRRFAAKLYIPLPETCARQQIIKNNLKNEKHSLNEDEIGLIAEKTEGYSGSDMKHLCSEAAMYSFKEVMEDLADIDKNDIRDINYKDFLLALNTVKPSFSIEDLKEYETWNKKFGSDF